MEKLRTLPAEDGFRMPGEFERHDGCIMIWPKRPGSWNYGAVKAREAFRSVALAIAESETVYMLAAPDVMENARRMLFLAKQEGAVENAEVSAEQRDAAENAEVVVEWEGTAKKAEEGWLKETACTAEHGAAGAVRTGRPDIRLIPMESDDAWARDVGPTFVVNENGEVRGIDWEFNAWGGTVDGLYAHWENDDRVAEQVCRELGYPCYEAHPFVLEGGAIHSDGEGTVLVTEACLLSAGRNPMLSKEEIELRLKQYLGAEKIIWLKHGIYQDETNEHVDNVCAFARPGEVLLAWTDDKEDPQYVYSDGCLKTLEQETDARGRKFVVHKLPIPSRPICVTQEDLGGYEFEDGEDVREAGERLAASYVNFYLSNGGVIVPQFGDEADQRAVEILGRVFPERRIYPIAARDILLGGGNIHCITQQIPAGRNRQEE